MAPSDLVTNVLRPLVSPASLLIRTSCTAYPRSWSARLCYIGRHLRITLLEVSLTAE